MLPWVKAPSLAILRWFESTKFSESSPCPDVLAVVAYRAAMAVGEAHKWGRRNFAKHCAISDFRARKIIAEASESEDAPTTGIQKPTTDQPPASKSIPRASQDQPSESHNTAVSEDPISHSHPADQPPASKSIPPTNHRHPLRARVLDQKRDGDREETEKEPQEDAPLTLPPMLSYLSDDPAAESISRVWRDCKPGERDLILDAHQVWQTRKDVLGAAIRGKWWCLSDYRKLRPRIAQYGTETMCQAIRGVMRDAWSVGVGKHVDVEWVTRPANIERFAALDVPVGKLPPNMLGADQGDAGRLSEYIKQTMGK